MTYLRNGPPPLIPIFDVDDDFKNEVPFRIQPKIPVKHETNSSESFPKTFIDRPFQLDSPVSLDGDGIPRQDFPILHGYHEEVKIDADNAILDFQSCHESNLQSKISIDSSQSDTETGSESCPSTPHSFHKEYEVDERLKFLFDDPLLLQDIVLQEKSRSSSLQILPDNKSESHFTVVSFHRLRRIYQSGSLYIYLRGNTHLVLVEAVGNQFPVVEESWRIIDGSTTNWVDVPPIAAELISTWEPDDRKTCFIMLLRDTIDRYWELKGVLGPLEPLESPVSWRNTPAPENHFESVNLSLNSSTRIEVTPDLMIDRDEENFSQSSSPYTHILEDAISPLVQSPIKQLISCPTFIFPSLNEMLATNQCDVPPAASSPNNFAAGIRATLSNDEVTSLFNHLSESIIDTRAKETYKCQMCSKEFNSKSTLKRHTVIHNPSEWKQCQLCDYRAPHSIKRHFARHHSTNPSQNEPSA